MEPAALLIHSSSVTLFPSPLRLSRLNSFLLQPIRTSDSLRLPRRLLPKSACENHNHHHHEEHHHRHCCSVGPTVSNYPQKVLIDFAKSVGWIRVANFLRENLHLCCTSALLFVASAACPYVIPKPYIKPLQNSLMIVAFPLVGISASLDALMDVAGGRVNIHVLMALAAFASVFMGNALEGGLLLSMFNLAHIEKKKPYTYPNRVQVLFGFIQEDVVQIELTFQTEPAADEFWFESVS